MHPPTVCLYLYTKLVFHLLLLIFLLLLSHPSFSASFSAAQVGFFDDPTYQPYCHWTFPDDNLETTVPSYMMARKLNRRTRSDLTNPDPKVCAILSSIECAFVKSDDTPTEQELTEEANQLKIQQQHVQKLKKQVPHQEPLPDDAPPVPRKALTGFIIFSGEQRERIRHENPDMPFGQVGKTLGRLWANLPKEELALVEGKVTAEREKHDREMAAWKEKIKEMGITEEQYSFAGTKKKEEKREGKRKKGKKEEKPTVLFNKGE